MSDQNATGTAMMHAISPSRGQALAEEGIRVFREHMKLVERFYALIHAHSMPSMLLHADGRVEHVLSDWTKDRLAEVDALAEQIKEAFPWEEYGLKRP